MRALQQNASTLYLLPRSIVMPLIRCADCGHEISDAAPACIYCGRPADVAGSKRGPSSIDADLSRTRGEPDIAPAGTEINAPKVEVWKKRTAGVVAFTVVWALLRLPSDTTLYHSLAGAVAGFLAGLIPFYMAKRRAADRFAIASVCLCSLVGAVAGLLFSTPLAAVLSLYVRRRAVVRAWCEWSMI